MLTSRIPEGNAKSPLWRSVCVLVGLLTQLYH